MNSTFIGIDPTAGQRPFTYAAIDHTLRLLALGQGNIDDILAFAAGQRQAVVAVCGPRQPNQGVLLRPEVRQELEVPPRPGRWVDFRLAEYLLRRHNISSPRTPSRLEAAPNWMQMAYVLFQRLEGLGYLHIPEDQAARKVLEVYPHACYTVLLGQAPFPKQTLEGRLQRQLMLNECDLHVPDPMRFFEEITRHRLLKGILPLEGLHTPDELDALIAAYTAWLSVKDPRAVTRLGDPEEGQMVLPVAELKARY